MRNKNSKTNKSPVPAKKQKNGNHQNSRENILRPELFSVPRHGHVLMTKERRKGEERSLVGKYLELADLALNSGDKSEDDAA